MKENNWKPEDFAAEKTKGNNPFPQVSLLFTNIFGLALIDTGNLFHSLIVSGDFWESIGGKISSPMNQIVGTADSPREGLKVLGIGESGPIYLEGLEECYILEPLVIHGLSLSVNLGIAFLQEYKLKKTCTYLWR